MLNLSFHKGSVDRHPGFVYIQICYKVTGLKMVGDLCEVHEKRVKVLQTKVANIQLSGKVPDWLDNTQGLNLVVINDMLADSYKSSFVNVYVNHLKKNKDVLSGQGGGQIFYCGGDVSVSECVVGFVDEF